MFSKSIASEMPAFLEIPRPAAASAFFQEPKRLLNVKRSCFPSCLYCSIDTVDWETASATRRKSARSSASETGAPETLGSENPVVGTLPQFIPANVGLERARAL